MTEIVIIIAATMILGVNNRVPIRKYYNNI